MKVGVEMNMERGAPPPPPTLQKLRFIGDEMRERRSKERNLSELRTGAPSL